MYEASFELKKNSITFFTFTLPYSVLETSTLICTELLRTGCPTIADSSSILLILITCQVVYLAFVFLRCVCAWHLPQLCQREEHCFPARRLTSYKFLFFHIFPTVIPRFSSIHHTLSSLPHFTKFPHCFHRRWRSASPLSKKASTHRSTLATLEKARILKFSSKQISNSRISNRISKYKISNIQAIIRIYYSKFSMLANIIFLLHLCFS